MENEFDYPVLTFLKRYLSNSNLKSDDVMRYPTAISQTLKFNIISVELQKASVSVFANPTLHGNQQGTIHGGFLCELADAAIGTAHSTIMKKGQSFTSLDLKINFIRPTWKSKLVADAFPIYSGKTITHYQCHIKNEENKLVASVVSTVMTLNGEQARDR